MKSLFFLKKGIKFQVRDFQLIEVSKSDFMTPSAFIFLYENQLFLTFRNRTASVWNFRGELVTSFDDHLLWHPDCNTNNIYITSGQDLIISYCKVNSDDPADINGKYGFFPFYANILSDNDLSSYNIISRSIVDEVQWQ